MGKSKKFSYRRHDAERILDVLVAIIGVPETIVDLGGGIGVWAAALKRRGARCAIVIDHRQDPNDLHVCQDEFIEADLNEGMPDPLPADLAICLEVVEHLPKERAEEVVSFLTLSAPLVLFSAAIPGQPGNGHINCRPPSYWRTLFQYRKYECLDLIRPRILNMHDVNYWYRQNMVLYCKAGAARVQLDDARFIPEDFELVHERVLTRYRRTLEQREQPHLGWLVRNIPGALRRYLRECVKRVSTNRISRMHGDCR